MYLFFRMLLDVSFVIMTLPLALLFFIIIAIAIKIDSKGPIFYTQKRTGKNGKQFKIYKFRTMKLNGRKDDINFKYDSRLVTKTGMFLRKHRFDELPQLLNVLKGEMSIIGPRPEVIGYYSECAKYLPFYTKRSMLPPGITGWAQINYKHTDKIEDAYKKLEYDLFYVFNLSFLLDLKICMKTVWVVFKGNGAR